MIIKNDLVIVDDKVGRIAMHHHINEFGDLAYTVRFRDGLIMMIAESRVRLIEWAWLGYETYEAIVPDGSLILDKPGPQIWRVSFNAKPSAQSWMHSTYYGTIREAMLAGEDTYFDVK